MGRRTDQSSYILYGNAMRPRAERWWLVPAPDVAGGYPPLHDVPISDRFLADLDEIPQTLSDREKAQLIADLEWRAEHGRGIYCGYMGVVGEPVMRPVSAPGPEPRFLLPTTAVIRVRIHVPEYVDLKDESKNRAAYMFPGKFRISSMGLPEFDPWNPDTLPDPD